MRRYTIFLSEKEFKKLEKRVEGTDLYPQDYLNLVIAKFFGEEVPKDKKKWSKFMDKRRKKIAEEPYKAEKVGQGQRYLDRLARVLKESDDPLTVDQLSKATGIKTNNVGRTLRSNPSVFEASNRETRKPFQPLEWVLMVDLN